VRIDVPIKGGKLPHLDQDLMDRLLSALLPLCAKSTGNLLTNRPTVEADMAFELFGQFMKEVRFSRFVFRVRRSTLLFR
jgi:Ca2+-transporting ATPase